PGMVGMHIANGMYGLILVEPKGGLPAVDREFYVMQGDFYTSGRLGDRGLLEYDGNKALEERPDFVVFNGRVGATAGENSLRVKKGETIRLSAGTGGRTLCTTFPAIAEVSDTVSKEPGTAFTHKVQPERKSTRLNAS